MNSILLILYVSIGTVLLYVLISRILKKKTIKTPDYIPKGRLGYKRIECKSCYATLIVEEIDRIENHKLGKKRIKIKVIEVSVDRDCKKSKEQCLEAWGGSDWVSESQFVWDEKSAAEIRQEKIDSIVGENNNNS